MTENQTTVNFIDVKCFFNVAYTNCSNYCNKTMAAGDMNFIYDIFSAQQELGKYYY